MSQGPNIPTDEQFRQIIFVFRVRKLTLNVFRNLNYLHVAYKKVLESSTATGGGLYISADRPLEKNSTPKSIPSLQKTPVKCFIEGSSQRYAEWQTVCYNIIGGCGVTFSLVASKAKNVRLNVCKQSNSHNMNENNFCKIPPCLSNAFTALGYVAQRASRRLFSDFFIYMSGDL